MTRRSRPRARIAAGLVAVAVGLAACVPDDGGEDATGGGELRLALSGEPTSFDPALQVSAGDGIWTWHAVYDTLLRCAADGTVEPAAAESFELSDDATTLTMTLREGMTFSDGSPIDADAAVASVEHMQNGGGSDAGRVAGMTVEAADERTVVVTAPVPTAQLPTFMCFAPGIVASPAQLESEDIGTRPVSSGPYVLDDAGTTTGSVYTYNKREDYWDADSYPYDTLVLTVMEDPTARLNALTSGQVMAAVIQQPQVVEAESSGVNVISNSGAWAGLFIADRAGEMVPALADVRVRQAINMVFDRQVIADGLFAGEAEPTTQIFNPASTAYLPELDDRYAFDVAAALALMAEAGYADGFQLEIPSEGDTDNYTPLVVQQLALLNIEVTEVPLTGPTALNEILGGSFPIFWFRISTADSMFDIVQSLEPGSIWNPFGSSDPTLQPLLDQAQLAQGDEAAQVFQDINSYVVEEAWFAPWVAANSFFATADPDLVPEMTDQFFIAAHLWDFR